MIFALICGFILLSLFTVITRQRPAPAPRPVAAE
jgi:general stress protein CsbA